MSGITGGGGGGSQIVVPFTPFLTGATGGAGQVYSSQIGLAVKDGRLVTLHGSLALTNYGTMNGGTVVLGGLPFAGAAPNAMVRIDYWANVTAAITGIAGYIPAGATAVGLLTMPPAGLTSSNGAPFATSFLTHTTAMAFVMSYLSES